MDSRRSYPYSYPAVSPPRQHGVAQHTSSAFSASANPNEDWTKISDLAERRRIQNRIAQRNYRKKLKKRLEDLERRAGSSSASPEQRPEELNLSASSNQTGSRRSQDTRASNSAHMASSKVDKYYQSDRPTVISDDRSMFSQQHMRQMSLSPPPFNYTTYNHVETPSNTQYVSSASYSPRTFATSDVQSYPTYLPPLSQGFPSFVPNKNAPIKQEYYAEDEISPFSMSYASMAGVDISYGTGGTGNGYREPMIHTPPLSESYEQSSAGSPPAYAVFPGTPISMPMTPPLQVYER